MALSNISLNGDIFSFAIGEMNNSFKPNQVIETFEELGVDLAIMAGTAANRAYIVTRDEDLFFLIGEVLSNSTVPIKMTMNERIFAVNASAEDVVNALMEAE